MFDQATATADRRHRTFFWQAGEVQQVWARRSGGRLFYLEDGGVDDAVRDATRAGELTCPYPGCPDTRFIARGGTERRHHFAHKMAGQEHRSTEVWRHQAMLMLMDWLSRSYPQLEVATERDDAAELSVHSTRTGRALRLIVTYDRRYRPPGRSDEQVLLGHSRALLLPRVEASDPRGAWWCGHGRLVDEIISDRGWAITINPQERLIATLIPGEIARDAGLTRQRRPGQLLCVIDQLDNARLDQHGVHTPASDHADQEIERRRKAEAERQRQIEEAQKAVARHAAEEATRWQTLTAARTHRTTTPKIECLTATQEPIPARQSSHWPLNAAKLRQLLDDPDLAQRLENPLPTDVACDVPPAIWHMMAVLEWRRRGGNAHPHAVRATIVLQGCGYGLTGAAVAGAIDVARVTT